MMSANYITDAGSGVAQYKKALHLRLIRRGFFQRSKSKRQSSPANLCDSSTNLLARRLERRMEVAQSNRILDKITHSRAIHHQLLFGNWNILTLVVEGLLLVEEAKRYDLNIVGVSSTKRRGSGTVNLDGMWKLFYLELIQVHSRRRSIFWGIQDFDF